jgi:hypothetical protein
MAAKGAAAGALPSPAAPAAPLSSPASGKVAADLAGDGRRNGTPPGRLSQIPGPKPGGRPAGSSGSGRNGPPVPLPPRCGTVPPALPSGQANGDDSDHGARAAACGDAGNGNPLGNDNNAAVAVPGKVNDAGWENDNRGGDDGDDNKNDDKWGRGA